MTRLPSHAVVVLDEAQCAYLALAQGAIRRAFRSSGMGVPPEVEAALEDFVAVARERVPVTADLGSSALPTAPQTATAPVEWITTTQAATELGITPRGVLDLVRRERITGRQTDKNAPWLIDARSVSAYSSSRRNLSDQRIA